MPISFWLYMIGGFSISGFPLFNGFISKTMTIEAAEFIQRPVIYLLLEGATVGTFLHTGLKLPWNIWLQGREEPPPDIRAKLKDSALNTPVHMLVGMGVLPLVFAEGESAQSLGLDGSETFSISGVGAMTPRKLLTVIAVKADGTEISFQVTSRLDTEVDVEYFENGGILPCVIRKMMAE